MVSSGGAWAVIGMRRGEGGDAVSAIVAWQRRANRRH